MSAITRCQSDRSATATRKPTAPIRRARRRRARSASARRLAMGPSMEPATASASAVATRRPGSRSGREERQRKRSRGDVLADGELALAIAEALAVEGHAGGSPAGRACTARRARASAWMTSSRSTPARHLHDEDEPAAPVAVGDPRTAAEALDARQRLRGSSRPPARGRPACRGGAPAGRGRSRTRRRSAGS